MILGFTGTRKGMNDFQKQALREEIERLRPRLTGAVHGDCEGADTEFHTIIRELTQVRLVIRPGVSARDGSNKTRAFNEGDVVHPPGTFFARNRDIVDSCDFLVGAALSGFRRGGTWQALRHARKTGRPGLILFRDAKVDLHAFFETIEAADRLMDSKRKRGHDVP